jgi:glycosyltransferase involved in cell wall biosynthesis
MASMSKVSVLIPARAEPFLQRTIDDLLVKSAGDIEVIAVLDGYWPDPSLRDDRRVRVIHWSEPRGLRPAINTAASIATGDFLLKIDAHCAVSPGFDVALAADCADNWVVVPEKYSLDPSTWTPRKAPWQYYSLTFPYSLDINHVGLQDKNCGPEVNAAKAHLPIDDIITYQGSCWFLSRTHWDRIGPMDAEHYYSAQEPQEVGLKTWLGGGEVKITKRVWYAHLWKGSGHKRGFPRFKGQWRRAHEWSADYWMNNRGRYAHDMRWLVEKFWDVLKAHGQLAGWPDDWDDPKYRIARERFDAGQTT